MNILKQSAAIQRVQRDQKVSQVVPISQSGCRIQVAGQCPALPLFF
jgi:hypothetical protein